MAFSHQSDKKTNVEPVHSYDTFHTRSDISGVKGIIGIVVVLSLSCSGVKTPLVENGMHHRHTRHILGARG